MSAVLIQSEVLFTAKDLVHVVKALIVKVCRKLCCYVFQTDAQ